MRPTTYNDSGNRRTQTTTTKQEATIMTQEARINISVFDCDHQPKGSQPELTPTKVSVTPTTEELLHDIRNRMTFFIPRETVGRSTGRIAGWYSTEQTYKW